MSTFFTPSLTSHLCILKPSVCPLWAPIHQPLTHGRGSGWRDHSLLKCLKGVGWDGDSHQECITFWMQWIYITTFELMWLSHCGKWVVWASLLSKHGCQKCSILLWLFVVFYKPFVVLKLKLGNYHYVNKSNIWWTCRFILQCRRYFLLLFQHSAESLALFFFKLKTHLQLNIKQMRYTFMADVVHHHIHRWTQRLLCDRRACAGNHRSARAKPKYLRYLIANVCNNWKLWIMYCV